MNKFHNNPASCKSDESMYMKLKKNTRSTVSTFLKQFCLYQILSSIRVYPFLDNIQHISEGSPPTGYQTEG